MPDLDRQLDRLFALPLSQFTGARNELAKQLRNDGRREEAEQVKALRKPSVAAWLVNRVVRERELDVQRLLNASETLRKAQADAASGKSEGFAEARRDEQRALERLAEAAREISGREGSGQAAVAQATQTLRAASLTDEGRELLKRGRLTEELEPPGFEALTGIVPAKAPKRRAKPKPRQPSKKALERVEKLRQAEREAVATAEKAEQEAERARAKAEAAAAKLAAAERELES
jgi:hypothetical protein